ncbi:hypothetical protein [Streptomyces ficellus]|uniref:LPXTG cell wall anchor domain-containing protein n=1 Tax=Streptomyces ficellus TaxID=1977088 RepID=A0A6I6FH03_9ACTN|nr:hypothetical protein [Streptomyces ficellus]QGV80467.1 hypothetical protein EIZ62_21180 [Streptomyces ficellus]
MRLRTLTAAGAPASVAASVAVALAVPVLLVAGAPPATADGAAGFEAAAPGRQPSCGKTAAAEFPIRTRITGGPSAYRPGGGFHTWEVELTNTTGEPCANIHPVIVFTDRTRALRPGQVQLEFYEAGGAGAGARQYPVTVEETDENELVGVLDDGSGAGAFRGFTVPPGRTVTVPVRLAFTSDARPDTITANAAVVQRRGGDGDWVGESADYRFALADGEPPSEFAEELPRTGRNVLIVAGAAAVAFLLGTGVLSLAGRLRRRRG